MSRRQLTLNGTRSKLSNIALLSEPTVAASRTER